VRPGRLFHRIYVSLLLVVGIAIALTAAVSHHLLGERWRSPFADRVAAEAAFVRDALPPVPAATPELATSLITLADSLRLDLAVVDQAGAVLAATRPGLGRVRRTLSGRVWVFTQAGLAYAAPLKGGGRLLARPRDADARNLALAGTLLTLLVVLAVGCHPIAWALTRRLEALDRGVRRLGSGDLGARVAVRGRDEVAHLAASFNWAAERIQRLVEAQRRVLASASHELRSPLARLRLAVEMMRDAGPEAARRAEEAIRDIEELDDLVEDVLLASRLEAGAEVGQIEPIDLSALAAEESGRVGALVEGQPGVTIHGHPRMLRRMVRNLLENARRHGGGREISAGVEIVSGDRLGVRLFVADRGPGIAPADRERIFEPFYRSPGHSESDGGAGLGLSLVREIARHHGGDATCRDREGGGTVFEVWLPADASAPGVTSVSRAVTHKSGATRS
jgi:signal transduction histidine kinase